uniref:Envelope protein n=1 Tax=Ficedula albicollis TaxID=59894 RepID=A0A803WEK1_FICAL
MGQIKEGRIPAAKRQAQARPQKKVRIGLLARFVTFLMVCEAVEGGCPKCYAPVYEGETMQPLLQTHTQVSPVCFDRTQLTTCKEGQKKYWLAKNLASFRQRLVGECPVSERFCLKNINYIDERIDLIKEKPISPANNNPNEIFGTNLFIELIEKISHELNITNCYVCGSTQTADIWPWEGISLTPLDILRWKQANPSLPEEGKRGTENWKLKTKIIGEICIQRKGRKYTTFVGAMLCKRMMIVKREEKKWVPNETRTYWTMSKNERDCLYNEVDALYECLNQGKNPFWGIPSISKYWENPLNMCQDWEAPQYLFWICGDRAYTRLPRDWTGICTVGIIKPAFFLLQKESGAHLGVPVYDPLWRNPKKRRSIADLSSSQKWKGEVWTPERIIKTYGPATWAPDGSWGYRTPIYMLNRIIRLQAVLEIVSNKTALALDCISDQLVQTRSVVYQIRLAVDYLLADEGGICGKFNTSECCLEIDDKSQVVKNISKEIRKIAYVGNQQWTPLVNTNWWDNFWSFGGSWWKKIGFIVLTSFAGFLILPCLIPCLIRLITSTVQANFQIAPVNCSNKTTILKLESQEIEEEANDLTQEVNTVRNIYDKFRTLRRQYREYRDEPETAN